MIGTNCSGGRHKRSWPQKNGGKPELGRSSLGSEKLPCGDAELDDGPQQEWPRKVVASEDWRDS